MRRLGVGLAAGSLLLGAAGLADESRMQESDRRLFVIAYEPAVERVVINRMHSWVVHVETADGRAVEDAAITVVGGMPEHDHGLPTSPQATRYLGAGDYLVEGVRFHMNGRWEVTVSVETDDASDSVTFELEL